jgi:hypothetical protein
MEDIINQIDGQVQVIFEKTSDYNQTYRDALWMTQEEYDSTSSETIESMKQQRFDNWLAIVNALPTE